MIYWILLLTCLTALGLFIRHKYQYFKSYDINHFSPFPVVGNMLKSLLHQEHFVEQLSRLYKAFPEDKFVGFYEFLSPTIFLTDIELIKRVTVKDFEYFLDHRADINEDNEPLFGRSLGSLKGQKWRDMRSTLSPAFTSSKIRLMVPLMFDCGREMLESLKLKMKNNKVNYLDLDTRDLCTRYANDVIASCAFGLKVNSLADENNKFYVMGKAAATFSFKQFLKMIAFNSAPWLANKLKITLFSNETCDYFRNLILGTMKNRAENNIVRPDMIHLLMEAKKGTLVREHKGFDENAGFATVEESSAIKKSIRRDWCDDDLVAQALIFFVAGFDTVATVLTFLLYELAVNTDVQDKLADEVLNINGNRNDELDYNTIQEMKYMDMVVSETLRKWPPAPVTDRSCVKAYNIGRANSESNCDVILQPGQGIWFSMWTLHRNPKYFPEPDRFDPERFSNKNKQNIQPFTYLPFGIGPRNCIGSRFALIEIKIMLHQIISHFRLEPGPQTLVPAELSCDNFSLRMKGGHWLRFHPRT